LALLVKSRGRYAEAESLNKRALEIREKGQPAGHPDIATNLNNLAFLIKIQGRLIEAEPLYKRALEMREKALPAGHPFIAQILGDLSALQFRRGGSAESLSSIRRVTAILIRRGTDDPPTRGANSHDEFSHGRWSFLHHVRAAWSAAKEDAGQALSLQAESFRTAQWAIETQTAGALARMAARFGGGNTALAGLVRERQDLQTSWQTVDKQLSSALSISPDRRGGADERARRQAAEIEARIAQIDSRLKVEFPEFFALARPESLSIEDATKLLRPDEALILMLAGHAEENFVWAVTREGVSWQRIPLGAKALADKVKALRKDLKMEDKRQATQAGKLFDIGLAHELYAALLGPVANRIEGKRHLLIVPSGELTSLPLHLLVTEPPATPKPTSACLPRRRVSGWISD
jgi:tetratricopeptide (TPR) repeat protein